MLKGLNMRTNRSQHQQSFQRNDILQFQYHCYRAVDRPRNVPIGTKTPKHPYALVPLGHFVVLTGLIKLMRNEKNLKRWVKLRIMKCLKKLRVAYASCFS